MEIPYKPSRTPDSTFVLTFDDHDFYCEEWKVPVTSSYKGKIICTHGIGEIAEIYARLFEVLSSQGYEIFFYKQRLNVFEKTTTMNSLLSAPKDIIQSDHLEYNYLDVSDLDMIIKYNLELRSNRHEKLYLLGNGLGSALIICYATMGKYQDWIRGLICMTPFVGYHEKTGPSKYIQAVTPKLSKLIPNVRVYHKAPVQYLTSNAQWTKYFETVLYKKSIKVTVSQFNKMLVRCESLRTKSFVTRFNPNIAILILHGDTNYVNLMDASQEMYTLLNNNLDKVIHIVKGGKHMLLHDSQEIFDEVLTQMLFFLSKYTNDNYGSVYNSL